MTYDEMEYGNWSYVRDCFLDGMLHLCIYKISCGATFKIPPMSNKIVKKIIIESNLWFNVDFCQMVRKLLY